MGSKSDRSGNNCRIDGHHRSPVIGLIDCKSGYRCRNPLPHPRKGEGSRLDGIDQRTGHHLVATGM